MIATEVLDTIQLNAPTYSDAQRTIAQYVLADPNHVINLSIHEMAAEIGTSASSITRFCKKLGFDSLRSLRINLIKSADDRAANDIKKVIGWLDDPNQLATNYLGYVNDVCHQTLELNSMSSIRKVSESICNADSIYLFGIGASALAVHNLLGKLTKLQMRCIFNADSDMMAQIASSARPKDIAIAFSYSGSSHEVLRAARNVKNRNCPLVAVVRQGSSPLEELANVHLLLPPVEQVTRVTTLFTNYSQSILVDVIFLLCAQILDLDPNGMLKEYRDIMSTPSIPSANDTK